MKYIVGLGNPGNQYQRTRHNVAWIIFDAMNLSDWKFDKYMNAEFTGKLIDDEIVLFIKPQTFMNRSGEIFKVLKKQEDFSSDQVVLLYDDIDLPFGKVRVSFNRGDGGHNGVKSVVQHLGTKKIVRIRVGVSRKTEDGKFIKPNVLSDFSREEYERIFSEISPKVSSLIEFLVRYGLEKTMNTFNRE